MKRRKMKSPAENMHRNLLHVFIFLTHYIYMRGNMQCPSEQLSILANKSNENGNAVTAVTVYIYNNNGMSQPQDAIA